MKKIFDIEVQGHLEHRRIFRWNYSLTRWEFQKENIHLPHWEELSLFGSADQLWIVLQPVTVTITFTDSSFLQYKLKRGHIWDKCSDPIFKGDLNRTMIPSAIHDPNFSCHFLGLGRQGHRDSNKLHYRMNRYFGLNWFIALRYLFWTNSIPGRARFENNRRAPWHAQTVEFMASSEECWR